MANKSIYLIADSFVKIEFLKEIRDGMEEILNYWPENISSKPKIKNFRDYYLIAKQTEKNLEELLKKSLDDPWREKINGHNALTKLPVALENNDRPFFSFLVTSFPMYNGKNRDEICIGLTRPLIGAILSVSPWQDNGTNNLFFLKQLSKHLTGHALGLFTPLLEKKPSLSHCENDCIMQPYDIMEKLIVCDEKTNEYGLCDDCQDKLALILTA